MWDDLVRTLVVSLGAVAVGLAIGWLSTIAVRHLTRRWKRRVVRQLQRSCRRAWTAVLVTTALYAALPFARPTGDTRDVMQRILLLALITAVAWLVVKVMFVAEEAALQWLRADVADNRRIRRVRTQITVLRRLTAAVIIVIALAAMLMTFTQLRTFGASVLASAGVIGAIAGLAAHTTLANMFAGVQLAMTDALRLDDVVVVEGEWGRVEEVTLTHVVVWLWDERRLVLPTSYFTTRPFQNWTRNEARVLGAVHLHLSYAAALPDLREEVRHLLEASPLWDGREWVLQVVDMTPATMVVRVLASSADAPSSWDLRCELREKLIDYLHRHHPEALPEVWGPPPPGPPTS